MKTEKQTRRTITLTIGDVGIALCNLGRMTDQPFPKTPREVWRLATLAMNMWDAANDMGREISWRPEARLIPILQVALATYEISERKND